MDVRLPRGMLESPFLCFAESLFVFAARDATSPKPDHLPGDAPTPLRCSTETVSVCAGF